MNTDASRVFDGFGPLPGGVNGGIAATLIGQDQCAAAKDFTFRDGYIKTRPPFINLLLNTALTGLFQRAAFYQGDDGSSSIMLSLAGRLYRVLLGATNTVTDITPQLSIVTTADFTVPAPAGTVNVSVTTETPFTAGETVLIDSGTYTVITVGADQLVLQYSGGAANATAVAGNAVQDSFGNQIVQSSPNPASADFVFLFQAENYLIVLAGQNKPVIFDGARSRLAGVKEIPPGYIGAYVWGRIWVALPNRRAFVAGDLVYGPSGTPQLGYRDAILKMTENALINGGGAFAVPGNSGLISAMAALAKLDTSLGQSQLMVGTENMILSVNAPVDRTTWLNLTFPIQTVSLIDYGPQGPNNIASVNGDLWYRSLDGIRSFITATRYFGEPGNTPQSREVAPVLDLDDASLLQYGSEIYFDNKLYQTVSPMRTAGGVVHRGMAVINFDLLSSMRNKSQPAWEGVYTGLNILQLLKGTINGVERAFMVVLNGTAIEIWEILKKGYFDVFQTVSGGNTSLTRTAIQPWMETRSEDFGTGAQLKSLYTGELYLDEIVDNVTITVKFRPDQSPTWVTWATVNLCANVSQCTVQAPTGFTCAVWRTQNTQYAARIMLPRPPEDCNGLSGRPSLFGYEFQFRIEVTGHVRIRKFRHHAKVVNDTMMGDCPTAPTCQTVEQCDTNYFTYDSHGT